MGGGSSNKQTSTSSVNIPPELQGIFGQSGQGMAQLLGGLSPYTSLLTGFNPQQIPGITPQEQQFISQIGGMAGAMPTFGGFNMNAPGAPQFNMNAPGAPQFMNMPQWGGFNYNAPTMPHMQEVTELGQIGTNPLFTAFEKTQIPKLLQANVLSGLGQGAQAEAISQASLGEAENIAKYNLQQVAATNAARQAQYGMGFQQWQTINQLKAQGFSEQMARTLAQNQMLQQGYGNQFQNWQAQNALQQQQFGNQLQNWQALNALRQQGFGNEMQSWQNQLQALQQGLTAAGLPRQIETQQGQAAYNELNAMRTLYAQLIGMPFGGMMQSLPQQTVTRGTGGK